MPYNIEIVSWPWITVTSIQPIYACILTNRILVWLLLVVFFGCFQHDWVQIISSIMVTDNKLKLCVDYVVF